MQVGLVKITFLDRLRRFWLKRLITVNLCPHAMVASINDGVLAEGYLVSSTKLVGCRHLRLTSALRVHDMEHHMVVV